MVMLIDIIILNIYVDAKERSLIRLRSYDFLELEVCKCGAILYYLPRKLFNLHHHGLAS